MIDVMEFFKLMEGMDENGDPKAAAVLQDVVAYSENGEAKQKAVDEAGTVDAQARFAVHNGNLVIALQWDDTEDMDYLRFKGFLKDFEKRTHPAENLEPHNLVLTVSDSGDYEHFITASVSSYVFDGDLPMVKFLSRLDDAVAYELSDEETEAVSDEAATELELEAGYPQNRERYAGY